MEACLRGDSFLSSRLKRNHLLDGEKGCGQLPEPCLVVPPLSLGRPCAQRASSSLGKHGVLSFANAHGRLVLVQCVDCPEVLLGPWFCLFWNPWDSSLLHSRLLTLPMKWRGPGRNASDLTARLPQSCSSRDPGGLVLPAHTLCSTWCHSLQKPAAPPPGSAEPHPHTPRSSGADGPATKAGPGVAQRLQLGVPGRASASSGGSGRASCWTPGSTGVFRLSRQRGLRGQRPPVSGGASRESPAAQWGLSLPLEGSRGGGPKGPAEELGLITGAWGCGGLRGGVLHLRCLGRGHSGSRMEEDGAWGGVPTVAQPGGEEGQTWDTGEDLEAGQVAPQCPPPAQLVEPRAL